MAWVRGRLVVATSLRYMLLDPASGGYAQLFALPEEAPPPTLVAAIPGADQAVLLMARPSPGPSPRRAVPETCCVQSMSTVHGDALGYHFWGVTAKPCAARRAPGASLACRPAPGMAGAAQLARPSPYPARRRTRWASWWTPRAARRARR